MAAPEFSDKYFCLLQLVQLCYEKRINGMKWRDVLEQNACWFKKYVQKAMRMIKNHKVLKRIEMLSWGV